MLLAVIPLTVSIDGRIKILAPVLLLCAGVWFVATSAATRQSYRHAWPVVVAALVFLGCMLWNALLHRLGWRPVDRAAHILLYLLVAAAFTRTLRTPVVWGGFGACAVALGAVCLVQHYVHGIDRAYGLNGGPSASIELATVLLGLSLLALSRLLAGRTGMLERLMLLGAIVLAVYGALLTQSRGPLLAFVPALALLLVWHARRTGHWRLVVLVLVGMGVGATVATYATHDELPERFAAIGPAVATYGDHQHTYGAVHERLEMWRAAWRALLEHPWAGIGVGRFHAYVSGEIAAGRSSASIGRYNQPHNQYLEAAANAGIPGLLVLLATFLLPLRYFARHALDVDEGVIVPACAGLAVVVLYMFCGLTDSVFYRVMPLSFYLFVVLGMALWIGRQKSLPVVSG
ncbi:MAG: O-antigen ligase family protein [Rhodanobacter sp.]